jgi:hypothetical protein
MGAPAEGALVGTPGSGPPPADPNAQRPGTGTARAAPIDPAALYGAQLAQQHQAQAHGSVRPAPDPGAATNAPYRGAQRRPKKSGAGLIIGLAVIALLLGAGAVVAYVMGTAGPTPIAVEPLPTMTTLTTPATTTAPPVTPPPNTGTAPPLTPAVPVTPVAPAKPHPSGSAAPKPSGSAAPSNGVIPPFPPFPSAFPSGFPSAFPLPSGFPTFQVPSGFPTFPPPIPPPPP